MLRGTLRPLRALAPVGLAALLGVGALVAQDAVLASLERRLAGNPRDAAGQEQLGVEYLRRGDLERAFVQFHKALAVDPRRGTPHFYLGIVYYRRDLPFKEIEAYQRALLARPDFLPARLNLAHASLSVGRIEEAIEQYRWVERREPRNPTVLYNLGLVLADLDRAGEAKRYLKSFIRFAPTDHPNRPRAAGVLARLEGREAPE